MGCVPIAAPAIAVGESGGGTLKALGRVCNVVLRRLDPREHSRKLVCAAKGLPNGDGQRFLPEKTGECDDHSPI